MPGKAEGFIVSRSFPGSGLPVTEKTYLFKELYIETIIRNPKKVGLFGCREGFGEMSQIGAQALLHTILKPASMPGLVTNTALC